jgi:hypothetical protein
MRTLVLPLLLLLPGCGDLLIPHTREGAWRPTGTNEHNLRVMAAVPSEIARGTGAPGSDGHTAQQAVERLRTDRVRPLPDSGVARLVPTGGGS